MDVLGNKDIEMYKAFVLNKLEAVPPSRIQLVNEGVNFLLSVSSSPDIVFLEDERNERAMHFHVLFNYWLNLEDRCAFVPGPISINNAQMCRWKAGLPSSAQRE